MPFIDLHCDTLSRLLADRRAGGHDTPRAGPGGHLSLEKLQNSGYLLQAFALFVDKERTADPLAEALAQADLFRQAAEANGDLLRPVLSFSDLEAARAKYGPDAAAHPPVEAAPQLVAAPELCP